MNIKNIKKCIIIILCIIFLECKVIAGYVEKINLKVAGQIAKPIFAVNEDEEIVGNYSNLSNLPEYTFEIKNYNEQNEVSQMDFNVVLEAICEDQLKFEVINCFTNEVILNNELKNNSLFLEKNTSNIHKYKVIVKTNKALAKDKLKLYIDAKYYKYELKVFNINYDSRNLEYEISTSQADEKYTNKAVNIQIKCNKEIKPISGFELSEDKTCLSKSYNENIEENILIEDFFSNKKSINVKINNIDKTLPEILGIEEGGSYNKGLKLIYKDNIGIKSIKIENETQKQAYNTTFDTENKIIDKEILIVKNNSINPYYLNQIGNYTIIVTDFAGNTLVRHINIK